MIFKKFPRNGQMNEGLKQNVTISISPFEGLFSSVVPKYLVLVVSVFCLPNFQLCSSNQVKKIEMSLTFSVKKKRYLYRGKLGYILGRETPI